MRTGHPRALMPQPRAFAARAAAPAPPARFPRGFLEWSSALEDAYLYDSALRRAVKILLDFCCGALAVTVALGVEDGARVRAPDTAWLAAGVGCLLVLGHALGGSYGPSCPTPVRPRRPAAPSRRGRPASPLLGTASST